MSQLNVNMMKKLFKNEGIQEKDYLSYDELYKIINKWNKEPFDKETFEQLWDQSKLNSKGEAKILDFVIILLKAEEILQDKISQLLLQKYKNGKILSNGFTSVKFNKQEMAKLEDEILALKTSLSIIRKPFSVKSLIPANIVSEQVFSKGNNELVNKDQQPQQQEIIRQIFNYNSAETPYNLIIIFYLVLILIIISLVSSLFINSFRNLSVYLFIMTTFTLNILSRKIIKFYVLLILFSLIIDIFYLILYTSTLWAIPFDYQLPVFISGYNKFFIALYVISLFLKIVVFWVLLSQFNLDELQAYQVTILRQDMTIQRQIQPADPNLHPLSYALRDTFNHNTQPNQ